MQIGKSLLAKFALYAPKSEILDAFAMRLERINLRESRHEVRQALFRGFAQSLEA